MVHIVDARAWTSDFIVVLIHLFCHARELMTLFTFMKTPLARCYVPRSLVHLPVWRRCLVFAAG